MGLLYVLSCFTYFILSSISEEQKKSGDDNPQIDGFRFEPETMTYRCLTCNHTISSRHQIQYHLTSDEHLFKFTPKKKQKTEPEFVPKPPLEYNGNFLLNFFADAKSNSINDS